MGPTGCPQRIHRRLIHLLAVIVRDGGELAALSGIPQSTISAIERDRINLGVERAKQLARALQCHPSLFVFPGWGVEHESAA